MSLLMRIKKKSFLSFILTLVLFAAPILFNTSLCEDIVLNDSEKINLVKEIWRIDSIPDYASSNDISLLTAYLNSSNPKVQLIALEKLLTIDNFKSIDIDGIKPCKMNTAIFEIAKTLSSEVGNNQIIDQVLAIMNSNKLNPAQKKLASNDITFFFILKGWLDYLPAGIEDNRQVTYTTVKNSILNLTTTEKKLYLLEIIDKSENVFRYEAAIKLIIENFGKDILDDLIQKLNSGDILPKTQPPPYDISHTRFSIYMTLLKSLPDEKSLSIVNELVSSPNTFIAKEAIDARFWINQNIAYPFKYERILLLNTDEF